MKVALVHDHLTQDGGAEKVLQALQDVYSTSPTYTLVYDKKKVNNVYESRDIRTSFIQKFPFGVSKFEWFLVFMLLPMQSIYLEVSFLRSGML